MNYNEKMTAFRRLSILNLLKAAPAYTFHEVGLKQLLSDHAQAVSTDVLRADLQWLHEQSLVLAEHPSDVWFATLTAKGDDVRQGLSQVPGVARPEPGAL